MKKKAVIICFVLIVISISIFNLEFVMADDDDDDGIDDEFEELNLREIKIEFSESEVNIESVLKEGENVDVLSFSIKCEDEGLIIEFEYESEYDSGSKIELEFGIQFHEIIEYIDIDNNDNFNPEIDTQIQNIELNDFFPVNYSLEEIADDKNLHYIRVDTKDGIFSAHMYIAEEFTIVNDSLITPNQIKINIEIKNFTYLDNNSQLALYTKLESELEFEEDDETDDEKEGYATNEQGIITTINQYTGFFTWQENASIDGISQRVMISSIEDDDQDEGEQKIYLNYPRGNNIFHDPKIGIENLWISKPVHPPFPLAIIIILILIIGAIGASIAYSVYHFSRNRFPTSYMEDNHDDDSILHSDLNQNDNINNKYVLSLLEREDAIENLLKLKKLEITALSEDFFEIIERFNWDRNEKDEFIKDLLSLSPEERKMILNKMLNRPNKNL